MRYVCEKNRDRNLLGMAKDHDDTDTLRYTQIYYGITKYYEKDR